MLGKIFNDTFNREEDLLRQNPPAENFDLKVFVILTWTALGMAIIRYYGDTAFVISVLDGLNWQSCADWMREKVHFSSYKRLFSLGWWIGTMLLVYFVVPALLIKFLFREKLSDYGMRWKGAFKEWWLYAVMLAIMVPLVFFFSKTDSFKARYPFYNPAGEALWPRFWIWEAMYFAQFIGLEFFFRGFVTLGLRHRFGYYSVFIMTIPYCMIHFGKPMPETIGAIFAGLILGTLSMKSRSIWLGVCIHYSIAILMDMGALWRKGFF